MAWLKLRAHWATVTSRCTNYSNPSARVDSATYRQYLTTHHSQIAEIEERAGHEIIGQGPRNKDWHRAVENEFSNLIYYENRRADAQTVSKYCEEFAPQMIVALNAKQSPGQLSAQLARQKCSNSQRAAGPNLEASNQHGVKESLTAIAKDLAARQGRAKLFAERCQIYFKSEFDAQELYNQFLQKMNSHSAELNEPSPQKKAAEMAAYNQESQKVTQESPLAYCERRADEFLITVNPKAEVIDAQQVVRIPANTITPTDN